ncbi:hypothetical protein CLOP_g7909 [Closterium sp. NIES-67]|nr:hypothetical protein CLOP_g7909 [Closterium sp. NIES-67]
MKYTQAKSESESSSEEDSGESSGSEEVYEEYVDESEEVELEPESDDEGRQVSRRGGVSRRHGGKHSNRADGKKKRSGKGHNRGSSRDHAHARRVDRKERLRVSMDRPPLRHETGFYNEMRALETANDGTLEERKERPWLAGSNHGAAETGEHGVWANAAGDYAGQNDEAAHQGPGSSPAGVASLQPQSKPSSAADKEGNRSRLGAHNFGTSDALGCDASFHFDVSRDRLCMDAPDAALNFYPTHDLREQVLHGVISEGYIVSFIQFKETMKDQKLVDRFKRAYTQWKNERAFQIKRSVLESFGVPVEGLRAAEIYLEVGLKADLWADFSPKANQPLSTWGLDEESGMSFANKRFWDAAWAAFRDYSSDGKLCLKAYHIAWIIMVVDYGLSKVKKSTMNLSNSHRKNTRAEKAGQRRQGREGRAEEAGQRRQGREGRAEKAGQRRLGREDRAEEERRQASEGMVEEAVVNGTIRRAVQKAVRDQST